MKIKKITIGSIATVAIVATPMAAIVSCGDSSKADKRDAEKQKILAQEAAEKNSKPARKESKAILEENKSSLEAFEVLTKNINSNLEGSSYFYYHPNKENNYSEDFFLEPHNFKLQDVKYKDEIFALHDILDEETKEYIEKTSKLYSEVKVVNIKTTKDIVKNELIITFDLVWNGKTYKGWESKNKLVKVEAINPQEKIKHFKKVIKGFSKTDKEVKDWSYKNNMKEYESTFKVTNDDDPRIQYVPNASVPGTNLAFKGRFAISNLEYSSSIWEDALWDIYSAPKPWHYFIENSVGYPVPNTYKVNIIKNNDLTEFKKNLKACFKVDKFDIFEQLIKDKNITINSVALLNNTFMADQRLPIYMKQTSDVANIIFGFDDITYPKKWINSPKKQDGKYLNSGAGFLFKFNVNFGPYSSDIIVPVVIS